MRIDEKLIKPIKETIYLSADNVLRYRAIIRFFYIQYEKIRYWLYKEDIFNELKSHDLFEDYTMDQCKSDLTQLTNWGNLIADQDAAKVHTVEDFKNKQFRYQLSEYSVEIERMVIRLENMFIEGASLEPSLLERLRNEISRLHTVKHEDILQVYAWWDGINNDFIRLNQNYQDYIRDLNSVHAEEMMKTHTFLVFKDKLVEYLRTFIKSLQRNTAAIEAVLRSVSAEDVELILSKVIAHELSIPRLDISLSEVYVRDLVTGRWESIVRWFVDTDGIANEAAKLFDATNGIIRRITRYASQITELFNTGANRKEEYRKLSEIFSICEDINQAHRLSALVFGVDKPIHLKGELSRETDSINSGVYDEPAFDFPLTPRIRTFKESVTKARVPDHSAQKKEMANIIFKQLKQDRDMIDSYIVNNAVDFSRLPRITADERNVLLSWLSRGLDAGSEIAKTDSGRSYRIDASAKHQSCELECNDGVFIMPCYKILFE